LSLISARLLVGALRVRAFRWLNRPAYPLWIARHEPRGFRLNDQRHTTFARMPSISVVVPVYNTRRADLEAMIESVLAQTYGNWQLCIADGCSTEAHVGEILDCYASKDPRIRVRRLAENRYIAANTNEAVAMATGEFVGLLDHDDTLAPFALFEVVKAVNENPDVDALYSDEDKLSGYGNRRSKPNFKPDFRIDSVRSSNYVCHFFVVRKSAGDAVGWFRTGYDGSQDHDLVLRVAEQTQRIAHIPKILYHWRQSPTSTARSRNAKLYASEAGRRAVADHLRRTGLGGTVRPGVSAFLHKAEYAPRSDSRVSIIVSPHGRRAPDRFLSLLAERECSDWVHDVAVLRFGSYHAAPPSLAGIRCETVARVSAGESWADLCRRAVSRVAGDLLLFVHDDTEPVGTDWVDRLVEHAQRPDVGIVGAKTCDRTGQRIDQAGLVIGSKRFFRPAFRYYRRTAPGYMSRLRYVQNYSAVSDVCFMTRRSVFDEMGGFDRDLSIASSVVDYCLRLSEAGYAVVWTPYAELTHHAWCEPGVPARDVGRMRRRWSSILERGDPCYNRNLTPRRGDFGIRAWR